MTAGYLNSAVLLLAALLLPGAPSLATGNYPGNALRVNGIDVSYQRFMGVYQEYQRTQGIAIGARGDQLPRLKEIRKQAMDLLVDQELVRQAAEAKGIRVTEEEVQAAYAEVSEPFDNAREFALRLETEGFTEDSYREHLRRMIQAKKYLDAIRAEVATVSDEQLETFYRENKSRLTLPEQVRVRHILLSWKPLGKPDDRAALYEQLRAIRDRAVAGEDFAALAGEYSDDATRVDGGDVGLFSRGEMVPAFEEMAFSLKPGEISDIVERPFGLHILKLEEHQDARLLPLAEIRDQLRDYIAVEAMESAVKREYERLRQHANIEILIPMERAQTN